MPRFDVYHYNSGPVSLVLDVQADLLEDLRTCVVVPLVLKGKADNEILSQLKPVIHIEDKFYILMTTDIGTVTRSSLGECITNIEALHRQTVTDALDFLFQGF